MFFKTDHETDLGVTDLLLVQLAQHSPKKNRELEHALTWNNVKRILQDCPSFILFPESSEFKWKLILKNLVQ